MATDYRDHFGPPPLTPEELEIVDRVLKQTLASAGINKSNRQAEGLAATLLQLFHLGFRDEEQLRRMSAKIEFLK